MLGLSSCAASAVQVHSRHSRARCAVHPLWSPKGCLSGRNSPTVQQLSSRTNTLGTPLQTARITNCRATAAEGAVRQVDEASGKATEQDEDEALQDFLAWLVNNGAFLVVRWQQLAGRVQG